MDIAEYSSTRAALVDLHQRFGGVAYDLTTTRGDKEARAARMELVRLRTSLETKRKELKAPALERSRAIDDEAKRLTGEILSLETPIDEQIKAEEQRREAERRVREAAEQERIARLHQRIAGIRYVLSEAANAGTQAIDTHLQATEAVMVDDSFGEFQKQAEAARAETLERLTQLRQAAHEREVEAARLKAEREAFELERAAEAKRATAAREAEAETARVAAAQVAAERADLEARIAAARGQRERIDAAARDVRAKADRQAAAARAEQDRVAAEARAVEQKRMDEERAAWLAERLASERQAQPVPVPVPADESQHPSTAPHGDIGAIVRISFDLPDGEAQALAQFVKRVGWTEMRACAVDDSEGYLIRSGIDALQHALRDVGFSPR